MTSTTQTLDIAPAHRAKAASAVVARHEGTCHCGAVHFAVELRSTEASRCNCSICLKVGITTAIVKPAAFTLLAGADDLTSYRDRFFCKHCGIQLYGTGHLEMLGGDFVGVNLNTLDDIEPADLDVVYFDGRHDNWQAGTRPAPWPVFTIL